jgi:acetyltransferase
LFEEKLKEFEPIFYPQSIAVVGASTNEGKTGSQWVKALISAGFPGPVYPVGSGGGIISGLKIFPSLRLVPGEVDYVIVSVPRQSVLELLDDCVAKKVKVVHFFTAGFSEMGKPEGQELEEQMVRKARQGDFRIIGPNCLGIYCPDHKIPCGPSLTGKIGTSGGVGFISQSGGIADKMVEIGIAQYINYSKGVSFGNGIDLDASDFLQYLAADPKTTVIGAYLEGTRRGHHLFDTMREAAKIKPLVIWKGGRTEVGAQAAISHTGSLTSSAAIWSAMLKQAGAIEVHSLEELTDTLLIFQQLRRWKGNNVAIIGGLADGGGGISVSASDACMETGLKIPPLSSKTREELTDLLGEVGSILRNPIDVSQARRYGSSNLFQAIELVVEDPVIELVLIQEDMDVLSSYFSGEEVERINDFFIDLRRRQNKPLVVVLPPGSAEPERLKVEQKLLTASIPVFPSMERAAKAIPRINQYFSSTQKDSSVASLPQNDRKRRAQNDNGA